MSAETNVAAVMTTVENEADADALATALVEARLAACVQRLPVRSVYRWKETVEKSDEILLIAKTRQSRVGDLIAFVKARHAYETPEIVALPIQDGWPPYLEWIETETIA